MAKATLTSKGQTTIPKEIREYLHINEGDMIEFVILENGTVAVKPAYLDASSIRGALYNPKRTPISIEEMNEAIRKRHRG